MKTAIKVFIWIGMITCGITIVPIIVGVLALKKLNAGAQKKEMQTMGALTLFFCSVIGGLLMLVSANEMPGTEEISAASVEQDAVGIETAKDKKISAATIMLVSAYTLVMVAAAELFFSVLFIPLGAGIVLFLLSLAATVGLFVPILFYFCNRQQMSKSGYIAFLCSLVLVLACMIVFVVRLATNGFDDSMFGSNGMVCGMALVWGMLNLVAIAIEAFILWQNRNILRANKSTPPVEKT